ncbi:hypothetical protein I4F81_009881 [Pyropia yezoensis]|uniref:Uncharacterized protein n=1 Tax=Pyropia yezoensis TaxID=2788 RepID=A0ACC3CB33_PYRYE|nr:hypothetical protein I4F81_009881 [Neopyropia yezoensis]
MNQPWRAMGGRGGSFEGGGGTGGVGRTRGAAPTTGPAAVMVGDAQRWWWGGWGNEDAVWGGGGWARGMRGEADEGGVGPHATWGKRKRAVGVRARPRPPSAKAKGKRDRTPTTQAHAVAAGGSSTCITFKRSKRGPWQRAGLPSPTLVDNLYRI